MGSGAGAAGGAEADLKALTHSVLKKLKERQLELLLQAGADTERVNDAGQTPVAAAVFRQRDDLVRMLVGAGADPGHGPKNAWVIAEYFGLEEMTALLRELSEGT